MIPSGARASDGFFGVVPQTKLSTADYQEMKAGGIESVRITVDSGTVAPSSSSFNFGELDRMVGDAARSGLPVLPAFHGSPGWLSSNYRTMPITGTSMIWWKKMLAAAVRRYGSYGSFWTENPSIPKVPLVSWQIWNEPDTSWFTVKPISPDRYANLVIESSETIMAEDSRAEIMIGGLYPTPGNNGTDADRFLEQLYQVNGFQGSFDFLGVHPYAAAVQTSIEAF